MKFYLFFSCLILSSSVLSCNSCSELIVPKGSLLAALSAETIADSKVILTITAQNFKGDYGSDEVIPDSAILYISKNTNFPERTIKTTKYKIQLDTLDSNANYYASVIVYKNAQKTSKTESIMLIPRKLQATSTIDYLSNGTNIIYISPNEQWLCISDYATRKLSLKNLQNKQIEQLNPPDGYTGIIIGWSSENNKIFIENDLAKQRAFRYYDLPNKKFIDLKVPNSDIWNYTFSPTGDKIVYTDYKRNGYYIYDFVAKTDTKLTNSYLPIGFSADGKNLILFGSSSSSGIYKLYSFNLTEEKEIALDFNLPTGFSFFSPTISSDGKNILFDSNLSGGGDNLWYYNSETNKIWAVGTWAGGEYGWLADNTFYRLDIANNQRPIYKYETK